TELESMGMRIHVVDATPAKWPVPIVAVLIVDRDTRAPALAAGYACRATPESAAEAALFEACQSRLTEIHGAREDVEQERAHVPEWLVARRALKRSVSNLPSWRGDMRGLLRALNVAAAAVDLTPPSSPIHVARVFVPGFRFSELLV